MMEELSDETAALLDDRFSIHLYVVETVTD
jgi:hypothetical protein